jgi:hypothetical protein
MEWKVETPVGTERVCKDAFDGAAFCKNIKDKKHQEIGVENDQNV